MIDKKLSAFDPPFLQNLIILTHLKNFNYTQHADQIINLHKVRPKAKHDKVYHYFIAEL